MVEFGIAIALLLLASQAFGSDQQRKCAVTIAANWTACTAYVLVSDNYTPWIWFWVMDILSAVAVTSLRPVSRARKALAFSYMVQFGIHAGYGLADRGDPLTYLRLLDYVLVAQMVLIFTWIAADGLLHSDRFRRFRSVHHGAHP